MKKRNSFVLLIAGVIGLITICTILYVFPAQEIVVPDGNGISVIYTSLLSKNILILLFVVSVSMVFISITSLVVLGKRRSKTYKKINTTLFFTTLLLLVGCSGKVEDHQRLIDALKGYDVNRISLEHYKEVIEVETSDPNFIEIIKLTSNLKIRSKYFGDNLYGVPIKITFYEGNSIIFEVSSGVEYTIVNGTTFNTSIKSRIYAEKLDTILGSYYGYDQ